MFTAKTKAASLNCPGSSSKGYIRGQIATDGKFQIPGCGGNRGYGLTGMLTLSPTTRSFLKAQAACLESLAGTGRSYYPVQFRITGSSVHMQFSGCGGNRSYGHSADATLPSTLVSFFTDPCAQLRKNWY